MSAWRGWVQSRSSIARAAKSPRKWAATTLFVSSRWCHRQKGVHKWYWKAASRFRAVLCKAWCLIWTSTARAIPIWLLLRWWCRCRFALPVGVSFPFFFWGKGMDNLGNCKIEGELIRNYFRQNCCTIPKMNTMIHPKNKFLWHQSYRIQKNEPLNAIGL